MATPSNIDSRAVRSRLHGLPCWPVVPVRAGLGMITTPQFVPAGELLERLAALAVEARAGAIYLTRLLASLRSAPGFQATQPPPTARHEDIDNTATTSGTAEPNNVVTMPLMRTPLVLVHGLAGTPSIFDAVRRTLTGLPCGPVFDHQYGLLIQDVRDAARVLGRQIDDIRESTGARRVHVVGHSLGGLIARYLLQCAGGDTSIDTLVTLGTPHEGTRLADLGAVYPLFGQLCPGSALMRELAAPAPGCRSRIVAVATDADVVIRPYRAALLHHRDLDVQNVTLHGVGHLSLASHPATLNLITAAVTGNPAAIHTEDAAMTDDQVA